MHNPIISSKTLNNPPLNHTSWHSHIPFALAANWSPTFPNIPSLLYPPGAYSSSGQFSSIFKEPTIITYIATITLTNQEIIQFLHDALQ